MVIVVPKEAGNQYQSSSPEGQIYSNLLPGQLRLVAKLKLLPESPAGQETPVVGVGVLVAVGVGVGVNAV